MLYVEAKGAVDVALPLTERLARESVHQVDADVADAGFPQSADGLLHLISGVAAMEEVQALVVEGLGTHRDAVDGELGQGLGIFRGNVIRVTFDGDFNPTPNPSRGWGELIHLIYIYKELAQLVGGQLAGGSAAEVYRVNSLSSLLSPLSSDHHLPTHRINVALTQTGVGSGVEGAIDAAAFAEGYMYVDSCHIGCKITKIV